MAGWHGYRPSISRAPSVSGEAAACQWLANINVAAEETSGGGNGL